MKFDTLNIVGSRSKIAKIFLDSIHIDKNRINLFSSNKKFLGYEQFNKINPLNKNLIVFLSHDRINNDTVGILRNFINLCKGNKNSRLLYLSTVACKYNTRSDYLSCKSECEQIVLKNNQFILRIGLFISSNPFSAYKMLIKFSNYFIKPIFANNIYVYVTKKSDFINFIKQDLSVIKKPINTIVSEKYSLNDMITKLRRKDQFTIKINVMFIIKFLHLFSKFFILKGFFGKIITLTAIEK